MSTTTQILFSSPALHSLKRDQLVKLCKLHSVKANGKNSELIERLKQRAAELSELGQIPGDDTEEDADVLGVFKLGMPRPSEQWEMVMDDIEEVDETSGTLTSMNTLRSKGNAGEFGTNGSKSSVTSSLKAIASSFGLTGKRLAVDKSTIASTSSAPAVLSTMPGDFTAGPVPESSFPEDRRTTQSNSPAPEPIPGNPSRPGVPAPANARLSTGTGITTTVRLISTSYGSPMPSPPRLEPYHTTFDLDMGTPNQLGPGRSVSVWPASPSTNRLYPAVPYEDLKPTPLTKFLAQHASNSRTSSNSSTPSKAKPTPIHPLPVDLPDMFSPVKAHGSTRRPSGRISAAQDKPFLFGSPLPQHKMTNRDFGDAATSVLEEMNKRLAEAGVNKVDKEIFTGEKKEQSDVFGVATKPGHKKTESGDRFAKLHEEAFTKMDSIATHYAARRVLQPGQVAGTKKRKSDALGPAAGPAAKRKSAGANHTGVRVISNGVRKNMGIPGGFGEPDDDEEEEAPEDAGDRRASKRIRVDNTTDVHKGRRVSLLPPQDDQTGKDREKEERKKDREREAIKRKLEASKARRRSSRARASIGGKVAPPAKPSRFGFLASAKSIVRNVWNMGAGNKAPSNNPAPKAPAGSVAGSSKGHNRVPSGSTLHKPTAASTAKGQSSQPTTISSQTRLPIPSFNGRASTTESVVSHTSYGTTARTATTASRTSVKPSSTVGASSMGTRNSAAPSARSNVSSMGAKPSLVPHASGSTKTTGTTAESSKRRPTSTLTAPTASSLAKKNSTAAGDRGTGLVPVAPRRRFASPASLQPITNGVASPHSPTSPRPTKIFTRPLDGFGSPSPEPEAAPQSLGGAATILLPRPSENSRPQTQGTQMRPKATAIPRKPRISRTRVIAKLGAQRAAGSSATAAAAAAPARIAPRARSSIGAAPRRSLGVKQSRVSGTDMLMSAKKKARQSEYARRRSQVVAGGPSRGAARAGSVDVTMDVDE